VQSSQALAAEPEISKGETQAIAYSRQPRQTLLKSVTTSISGWEPRGCCADKTGSSDSAAAATFKRVDLRAAFERTD
jgi:hypothetical protein